MSYTVLVVDDTHFMRKMATDHLKEFGYTVVGEATNGKEAIKKYKEEEPDIVMMDLTMPEMNGIDAIQEILKINNEAVILICSASNQQDMISDAMEEGAKGYLKKPFNKEQMNEVIQKYALPHLGQSEERTEQAEVEVETAAAEPELVAALEQSQQADGKASAAVENVPFPVVKNNENKELGGIQLVTSYMCNWQENIDGETAKYAVTCTENENKVIIEMLDSTNTDEKKSIQLSLDGFRQLNGWLMEKLKYS